MRATVAVLVVFLAGQAPAPATRLDPAPAPGGQDPKKLPVSIKGTVRLKGKAPQRKKIQLGADPKCVLLHKADQLLTEEVLVDAANHLQWAFVYVKSGLDAVKKPGPPKTPVVLDQKGCHYEPHVLGIMVGQDFLVRCSDDLLHIPHAVPASNREWGFSQEGKGKERTKVFTAPEVMVPIKCDVHQWMKAWLGVLDHPWYGVTDAGGRFEIRDLPAGKYTLEVWHEAYKPVTKEVEVKEKAVATADFEITDPK